MTTTTCFHGTTAKGLQNILNSTGCKVTNPWTASDNDSDMYFWPDYKVAETHCLDLEEDSDDILERGLENSFNAASVQACVSGESEFYTIVCEIPTELLEDDYSCENMEDAASVIPIKDFDTSMIKTIYKVSFNKWLIPFVAAGFLDNNYFNKWALDEGLLIAAKAIGDSEIYSVYDTVQEQLSDYIDVTEEFLK